MNTPFVGGGKAKLRDFEGCGGVTATMNAIVH
jgi:hypothetical protein